LRRITRAPLLDAADVQTQWSPDGRRQLFVRKWSDGTQAIYTVGAHGGPIRRVTPFALRAGDWPDWSPDGRRITLGLEGTGGAADIYTMRTDGTDLRQVSHTPERDSAPDWGGRR
jgi:TolB protein